MIRFIHISDTHIGPTKDYELQSVNTHNAFLPMVEELKKLPFKPDFIIHTGDIATDPDIDSYKLYASMIASINIPVYYVTGNHDESSMIKKYLPMGEKKDLSEKLNTYLFTVGTNRFLTIDGKGPREIDPHGVISDEQMEILKKELETSSDPLSIFIHFPAFELDSIWLNKDMLLLNGEEFHRLLVPHADRIQGVFFGHVHRGMQIMRDGILYSSVASMCIQSRSFPRDEHAVHESTGRGYFNVITHYEDQTVVKEYSVKNGSEVFRK